MGKTSRFHTVGTIVAGSLLLVLLMLALGGNHARDAIAGDPAPVVTSGVSLQRSYGDLLLDEGRGLIYAAGTDENGDGVLDVVDLQTLTVVDSVSLPFTPLSLALSGDGGQLAATGAPPAAALVFVDLDSREVSPALALAREPLSLAYGRPGRLFAGYGSTGDIPPAITVIDTVSATVVNTVTLPASQEGAPLLATTAGGAELFVLPAVGANPISKLNALSDTLPLLAQTGQMVASEVLAVTADGSRVFTANAIWEGTLNAILAPINLSDYTPAINMVYEPALERLYLQTPADTRVFDAVTGREVERYDKVFNFPGFVVSPSQQRLYYLTQRGEFKSLPWRYYYGYLPTAARGYPLLYFDDFADPASGWDVEDTGSVSWSYQAGEYEMLVRNQEWWALIFAPVELDADNYRLDVELRQAAATGAVHGIVFDWRDPDNFNLLVIVPDAGLVGLYAAEFGSWVSKQPLAPHPAAAVGTDWHHVRVEQASSGTGAWINGVKVVDLPASYFPAPSGFGFYLETLEQVPSALRVDEVVVYSLPWDYVPSGPVAPLLLPRAAEGQGRIVPSTGGGW